MGQSQSYSTGSRNKSDQDQTRRCYYQVLGIEPQSLEDDIKKAYRKKALELHPDRNPEDIEESTRLFAEIQSAYEVLSDPHERAWYDSHKDAILRNDTSQTERQYESNVRMTTADDITNLYIKFTGRFDFSDRPSSFYNLAGQIFDKLALEENACCRSAESDRINYPSFGSSKDTYEGTVKPFYATWSSFATKKDFAWKDMYRYSEAPDRRTRRVMEKENRRVREESVREFNEAVKALVAFVKKRDPRHTFKTQTEEERQTALREMATIQAIRSRTANQARYSSGVVAEWTKTRDSNDEVESDESEDVIQNLLDCVVCKKTFKSKNQYVAHERSKKHTKAAAQLRRQMAKEHAMLDLDKLSNKTADDKQPSEVTSSRDEFLRHEMINVKQVFKQDPETSPLSFENPGEPCGDPNESLSECSSEKDFSEEVLEHEFGRKMKDWEEMSTVLATNTIDSQPKKGKAKEKQARKSGNQIKDPYSGFQCLACSARFSSNTKLFNHIKNLGHAQPMGPAHGSRNKQQLKQQ